MADLGAIISAIGGLKTAADIAKDFLETKEKAAIQQSAIELQSVILAAQTNALAAQSDQSRLLERIRELEAKLAQSEAWATEKERYNLTEPAPGITAYFLKPETSNGEPAHAICANCFSRGRKSILQFVGNYWGNARFECHDCKSQIEPKINQPLFPFKRIVDNSQN